MLAFFNLGPWELAIILVALVVLLGGPVLVMAGIVWFKRWRRKRQARGKARESQSPAGRQNGPSATTPGPG